MALWSPEKWNRRKNVLERVGQRTRNPVHKITASDKQRLNRESWREHRMKLCRFGAQGDELPGLVDHTGCIRDLSSVIDDIRPEHLTPEGLEHLAEVNPASLPLVPEGVRLGVPWTGISKYVGIGLNYIDHAREANLPIPEEPIIFLKATSAICGPNDDTTMPRGGSRLDWEVELGVVIGSTARYVTEEDADSFIAGYCVLNDVSERGFQMQSSQWDKGKGCDTFGPIGPWLVTKNEVPNPGNLKLWSKVNGEIRQDGNTSNLIFGIHTLVSCVSHYMTLLPGDVIATGTPAGVALGMKPEPQWLRPGDVVEIGIERLGTQRQVVVG